MNETNILADVEVPYVESDFSTMYRLQFELQERLGQLPETLDFKHMAQKSVYWGHCIRAEIVELIEWVANHRDPTWIKEAQMEAIDVLHFVFNLGIEMGLTTSSVNALECGYEHQDWEIDKSRIHAASILLETSTINHVNLLPWKTWKTYTTEVDMTALASSFESVLRACLMLCNASGLARQDIINMYYAKNKVNHRRQDNGY